MNPTSNTHIDFYVSVIDNYGDMGFAVNLALSLHEKHPGVSIRFFSDDKALFRKFFVKGTPEWVEYISFDVLKRENPPHPSEFICSFFDYPLPKSYLAKFSYPKTIIVFSYFLLHKGLESLHGTTYVLESGYDTVIHFVPSLLPGGWGIIINPAIEEKKSKMSEIEWRKSFLESQGLENVSEKKWVSVFVYPETLEKILPALENHISDTMFFVFGGVEDEAMRFSENIIWMPFLSLEDYGIFQSLCDANIVRGENSLCQGLLSGKPILWDIYKESNVAHREKTEDFIRWIAPYFGSSTEYTGIARDFMNTGSVESFEKFTKGYSDFEEGFIKISEDVKGECDLVEKLEKILRQ